jgi:hypothetical protein
MRRNAGILPAGVPNEQAGSLRSDTLSACMSAAVELEASRTLIDALGTENSSLKDRLATEQQITSLLTELNATRQSENHALRITLAAKNETIAAKDAAIASQDKLIDALKRKKPSPWRRLGDILIGAATIAVLK